MNLVDSSAWLEYFANGPNAGLFAPAVEETDKLAVPTVCLLEVFKRVSQQRGEGAALRVVAQMQQGKVVDLDGSLALSAAKISLDTKLPLPESIILATARAYGAVIWTQDAHFAEIKGVKYAAKQ